ncbi:hypothetical protein NFI96_022893, partial [Prochilodus magdalenae]
MRRSEEVWEQTHQRIKSVLRRHKRFADRRRTEAPSYAPGDRVWLSTRDFRFVEGNEVLPATIPPSPFIVEGEPVYAVRRLLDSRRR